MIDDTYVKHMPHVKHMPTFVGHLTFPNHKLYNYIQACFLTLLMAIDQESQLKHSDDVNKMFALYLYASQNKYADSKLAVKMLFMATLIAFEINNKHISINKMNIVAKYAQLLATQIKARSTIQNAVKLAMGITAVYVNRFHQIPLFYHQFTQLLAQLFVQLRPEAVPIVAHVPTPEAVPMVEPAAPRAVYMVTRIANGFMRAFNLLTQALVYDEIAEPLLDDEPAHLGVAADDVVVAADDVAADDVVVADGVNVVDADGVYQYTIPPRIADLATEINRQLAPIMSSSQQLMVILLATKQLIVELQHEGVTPQVAPILANLLHLISTIA